MTELKLATCSFTAFDPAMGVAVRTTVGAPRFFKHRTGMVNFQLLAPHGIFHNEAAKGADGSWDPGYKMYQERLTAQSAEILHGLSLVQEAHGDRTLVLLCFENVHKLGDRSCHRRWAADWFRETHGIVVPEVSSATPPPRGTSSTPPTDPAKRRRRAVIMDPSLFPLDNPGGEPGRSVNPFEARARARKAAALADAARGLGVSVTELANDPARRKALVKDAGVRKPSETTWELVYALLAEAA